MENVEQDITWINMGDSSLREDTAIKEKHCVVKFNYYEELKMRISPDNFMDPYIADKVEIANGLYKEMLKAKNDMVALVDIRRKSETMLGIGYNTEIFYAWLMQVYSPQQFIEPYDSEKFQKAHEVCSQLTEVQDDFAKLEDIWIKQILEQIEQYTHNETIKGNKILVIDLKPANGDEAERIRKEVSAQYADKNIGIPMFFDEVHPDHTITENKIFLYIIGVIIFPPMILYVIYDIYRSRQMQKEREDAISFFNIKF